MRIKIILYIAFMLCFSLSLAGLAAAEEKEMKKQTPEKAAIAQETCLQFEKADDRELARVEGAGLVGTVWKKMTNKYKSYRESKGDWCPTWFLCAKPVR
jgi:hypothetical protein